MEHCRGEFSQWFFPICELLWRNHNYNSQKNYLPPPVCLVNRATFFLQNHLLDEVKLVGQTGKHWHHQMIIHFIPIPLWGWLKQGSVNRSNFKWSWSKLLAQTKVKIRKGLKGKDCRYISWPKKFFQQTRVLLLSP